MRKPWFHVIEVVDAPGRRSLDDIAQGVTGSHKVSLREMRGYCMMAHVVAARRAFILAARAERPDLSSERIGDFIGRDSSAIRHTIRKMRAAA